MVIVPNIYTTKIQYMGSFFYQIKVKVLSTPENIGG